MKAIAIVSLLVIVVALVAIPAGAALETKVEQARANRLEEQSRLEAARADAYAVRSQANQPALVAVTGIVLAAVIIGGLAVVLVARRPATLAATSSQHTPAPQIHVVVLNQLPGESRPEYLRRVAQLAEPDAERSVVLLDQRHLVDAER